jgi:electron transfer flavoprotein beta subunit
MDVVVCVKQIIDPETTPERFTLDPVSKRQVRGGLSLVISAFDENALEVALQLREKSGTGKVTALCLGDPDAQAAVRSAMAMGLDAGVLVSDPAFAGSDAFGVAHILAKAIQKIGVPDLILTGCVSGDTGDKMVGPLLADELGIPSVCFVRRIEAGDGTVVARRVLDDGYELIQAPMPLVATILSDDTNAPRYRKVKDIMAAARKPVPVWKAADLGVDPARVGSAGRRLEVRDVALVQRDSRCELVSGETPAEQAERLATRLRELRVI